MKRRVQGISAVSAVLLILGPGTGQLAAQQETAAYAVSACFKALPGKTGELRNFLNHEIRVLGETGVSIGQFVALSVLEAWVPRGTDHDCDFILNVRHNGYPSSVSPGSPEGLRALGITREQLAGTFYSAGFYVRTNLWRVVANVGQGEEGSFAVIDSIKTHDREAWEELESEIFQPMQQARVDAGDIQGWGASALIMPRGTSLEYNAVTYNVFRDMEASGKAPGYDELFAKVHRGKDRDAAFAKTREAREIVESALYRVMVSVSAE